MSEPACRFDWAESGGYCTVHNSQLGIPHYPNDICNLGLAALRTSIHVPGVWKCHTCPFVLHKNFLHAESGAVRVNDKDESELCPNDGATMLRHTWKEYALEAGDRFLVEMEETKRLRAQLDAIASWSPVSASACPLCTYEAGKFISSCAWHREVDAQARVIGRLQHAVTDALKLLEEAQAQWGEDYLWKKWEMSEAITNIKALSPEPKEA